MRAPLMSLPFVALLALFIEPVAAAPQRPNILLIVADDLGWKDVGWHGGPFQTPNLDQLVATGVELDRHYVQPVCTPTRTALLSGRWTGRFGPQALAPSNRRIFPAGTPTLASVLKSAGYSTFLAGKWHLGSRPEWGPNHYGFDHSYGSLAGAADPWTHQYRKGPYAHTWHRDCQLLEEEGNATDLIAGEVEGWIESHQEPWFIYVPFTAVHIPIDAPQKYRDLYADAHFDDDPARNESQQRFGAYISQLDDRIGRFVSLLDETGQRDNTLIVFTSDNGGLQAGGNAYISSVPPTPRLSSNLPLRGAKNTLYEGGVRVCAFANWPGTLSPRKVEASLHAVDWLPTITSLCGCQIPDSLHPEGVNVWPLLKGETTSLEAREIYIPHPQGAILLYDGWKLISFNKEGRSELYHVEEDISEKRDRAAEEPQRLADLQARLTRLQAGDLHEIPSDLRDAAP